MFTETLLLAEKQIASVCQQEKGREHDRRCEAERGGHVCTRTQAHFHIQVNENKQSWETTHAILQPQHQPKPHHTIQLLLNLSSQLRPMSWVRTLVLSKPIKEPN